MVRNTTQAERETTGVFNAWKVLQGLWADPQVAGRGRGPANSIPSGKKSSKDPSFLTATICGAFFLMLTRSDCLSTGLLPGSMAGRKLRVAAGRKKRKGRLVST